VTARKQQHVWLVMANDWPEAAFASEALADDFCMQANARDRESARSAERPRVYYRWYKLEVLAGAPGGQTHG
jgi:hypothetical protein